MTQLFFILFSLVLTQSGWAQAAQKDPAALSKNEKNLMKAEALRLWEKRDVKESLDESLSKFELALGENPQDVELLTYLARGYFLMADYHTDDSDRKKSFYERAVNFGKMALATNQGYAKKMKDDVEAAIKELTAKEIDPLYWTAASLGKWARARGVFSSLSYKGEILAMVKHLEKLKPDYFYGAVPRYWGSFYASAPSIAGGDMKKSKKNFQKSMKMAPEYLGTKVLYAEIYLVKKDAKKEFKEVLQSVIETTGGPKDIAPENAL